MLLQYDVYKIKTRTQVGQEEQDLGKTAFANVFVNRPICAMLHADFCIVLLSFNPLFACPLVCSHNPGSRSANPAGGKTFLFLLFLFLFVCFLHFPSPHVPRTILISLFIMSLIFLHFFCMFKFQGLKWISFLLLYSQIVCVLKFYGQN